MGDCAYDKLFAVLEGEVVLTQTGIDLVSTCRLDDDIRESISRGYPPNDLPWLMVCVDIEKRLYVNGYFELPFEDYVPDGWVGRFGDPYDFVPEYISERWRECIDYQMQFENKNKSCWRRILERIRSAIQTALKR